MPSAFFWIGQGGSLGGAKSGTLDTGLALHHPRFAVDEKVLATGVALHAYLAMSSLKDLTEVSHA